MNDEEAVAAIDPLVQRCLEGDERAFRDLFVRHRHDVSRIVFRVMGPSADLEDVVQEVFVHVYRSLRSFRGDAKLSTWLHRLAVNVTLMHLRRARSRPRFADVPVPEAPHDLDVGSPQRHAERAERVRALYRALETLTEKKRTVFVLHDLEGLPAKEVAEIVGAPVLTVRTRLFYARREILSALAREPSLGAVAEELMAELGITDDKPGDQP
ncbi:MAG: sigma-70 family RNA polymerase sigma factor [Deltaproteobacteria bacterium]|nr:sigma-70 family RNA polymerase sigma factor [Deltaproteobacteria bacterium]